jgi:hypothetical protein
LTIEQQLHRSATHKLGSDPNCPACAPTLQDKLRIVIEKLERCAEQNEQDGGEEGVKFSLLDAVAADAVAAEQRRVIKVLTRLLKD